MKQNKWRRYFLYLFSLNVLIVGFILASLFWPQNKNDRPDQAELPDMKSSEFTIHTSKDNLNQLINAYIEELTKDNKYHYEVTLADDVQIEGEIPVFSAKVPLSIHLDPYVLEDGNLVLKQTSISLGGLKLPNRQVMKSMEWFFDVPNWVRFYPEYEEIHVRITDMDIKSNFYLQVEQFDLENNDLSFKIAFPYEDLGIQQ